MPRRMIDQRQRACDAAEALDHHRRRVVVERRARGDEPGEHAHDQAVEHRAQRRHVGGPHVAVALGVGERPERRHQLGDVGIVGGTRRELDDDRLDGVGEIGQQRQVEGGRRARAARRRWRARSTSRLVAACSTVVPCPASSTRRTDHSGCHTTRHVSRNVPLVPRPSSSEPHGRRGRRAGAAGASGQPVRRAQVELDHRVLGLGLEPHPALPGEQVAGERNLRRTRREPRRSPRRRPAVADERQAAHHRVGGVEHLVETGPRPAAQHRQRLGHPRSRR